MASTSRLRRLTWPVSMRQILASDHSSCSAAAPDRQALLLAQVTEVTAELPARNCRAGGLFGHHAHHPCRARDALTRYESIRVHTSQWVYLIGSFMPMAHFEILQIGVSPCLTQLIEAWDQWVEGYELKPGAPDDEHGRGLTVVAALSDRWGAGRISEDYKAVWCELIIERPSP
jgi:hypothetical protein